MCRRSPLLSVLLILFLTAGAAAAIPLPQRLLALGLGEFVALHDEVDEGGGKGGGGGIPDHAEGAPCAEDAVDDFACRNVDLLAFLPLAEIGGGSGNDIWGWTDAKSGREFVLMGRSSGIAFVEVTDPTEPVYLGNLPTETFPSSWRDMKVYRNHAYIVADSAGAHGVQVFDLRQLKKVDDPPVEFEANTNYDELASAHNIAINEETGFAYVVGATTCSGGLHMVDLSSPKAPRFAGCFSADGYTHDVQCAVFQGPDERYQGSEICFAANEDTLTIVDVTDKDDPRLLARAAYGETGYTHQGWLTEDHRYFLLDDELDERTFDMGTRTMVWDLSDLEQPVLTGEYVSPKASIDHNQVVKGRHTYQANYTSGLRILELEDLAAGRLEEVAFFDTHPEDDDPSFDGAWGVYPWLKSGAVAVSDINRGLFIVRPRLDERLFADGFESGDLSFWSRRRGQGLSVVTPGLGGSEFALEVAVDGRGKSFVSSTLPGGQGTVTVDLLLAARNVGLADGEIEIARLLDRKKKVASLLLGQSGGRYQVRLVARDGKRRMLEIGSTRVPANGETQIRVEWRRASGKKSDDGLASLWKDGSLVVQNHHLENGRLTVSDVRLGRPGGAPDGAAGSFLVDELVVQP